MGDRRFARAYARLHAATDRAGEIRAMGMDELIAALAAHVPHRDPLLVNVMATELQNRTRRALAVAQHVGEAVLVADPQGNLTYANPVAGALLGVEPESMAGRLVREVLRLRDGLDGEILGSEEPTARALATGEEVDVTDLWLLRADGTQVPVDVRAAPVGADDVVFGAVTCIRDVSAQRRAQAQLRLHKHLLDAVGPALMATDLEGRIIYWNHGAEKLYGWRADEVAGKNIIDVTPTDASRADGVNLMDRMRKGEPWAGEFSVRRKDGTAFRARVENTPVLDDRGALIAIVGVSTPAAAPGAPGRP